MDRRVETPPGAAGPGGVDQAVGRHIRAWRKDRALSLEAVSAATGLSIGFISQIERGISSPTLRALTALADALGASVADLVAGPGRASGPAPTVARAGERKGAALWKSGIYKQVLAGGTAAGGAPYGFSLLDLESRAGAADEPYAHRGEEAGYVLQGRLRLVVGERSWTLGPGDSFHFDSSQPHRFENPGRGRTRVVMVNLHRQA